MPKINFTYTQAKADSSLYGPGFVFNAISRDEFASFTPAVLGLGDVSRCGSQVQSLAVFLDLEGFTDFCYQVDSQLVIPEFLSRYFDWLFRTLSEQFREGAADGMVRIWGSLPFYAKFLGDGLLFLWDTDRNPGLSGTVNIARNLLDVTQRYETHFVQDIRRAVSKPPLRLRCGMARGQIVAIGGGADYVGPCINVASRLQKLASLSFAVSARGFDLSRAPDGEGSLRSFLVLKEISLRGVGDQELVYIRKDEFEALQPEKRAEFRDP
jgi:class 3 adenylate cyclase